MQIRNLVDIFRYVSAFYIWCVMLLTLLPIYVWSIFIFECEISLTIWEMYWFEIYSILILFYLANQSHNKYNRWKKRNYFGSVICETKKKKHHKRSLWIFNKLWMQGGTNGRNQWRRSLNLSAKEYFWKEARQMAAKIIKKKRRKTKKRKKKGKGKLGWNKNKIFSYVLFLYFYVCIFNNKKKKNVIKSVLFF